MAKTKVLVKCNQEACEFVEHVELDDESLSDINCFGCGKRGTMKPFNPEPAFG